MELMIEQVEYGDLVVINKTDLVDESELAELEMIEDAAGERIRKKAAGGNVSST